MGHNQTQKSQRASKNLLAEKEKGRNHATLSKQQLRKETNHLVC